MQIFLRSFFYILLLLPPSAQAASGWANVASGSHSFKSLGPQFFQEVSVRPIAREQVKLAFVNRPLAERLGLPLPQDPEEVEKMLGDLFAWEIDPSGTSPKKWFATYYQDSAGKTPGEARGDGRALWTGEMILEGQDGRRLYIDGVQKGVGATALAWTKNPGHSSGQQDLAELTRSGVNSIIDFNNQLDSTEDLLGFVIKDSEGSARSMTLRVGKQTRPAHIRYHSDNPADEKKIMDYIVVRDLGLPLETPVTKELFLDWERQFVKNNAEDAARAYTLNAFFLYPTMGNKTTTGGSIDLNGREYLDSYPVKLEHGFQLTLQNQIFYQRQYIFDINNLLRRAQYPFLPPAAEIDGLMKDLFDQTFVEHASQLQLVRLGLDEQDIQRLTPEIKQQFLRALDDLMRAQGPRRVKLAVGNTETLPAAFDTRKILTGTMPLMAQSSLNPSARQRDDLFQADRRWASKQSGLYQREKKDYIELVQKIIATLGGQVQERWIKNAQLRNSKNRFDATEDGLTYDWLRPAADLAYEGADWTQISDFMGAAADTLTDPGLPKRSIGMLRPSGFSTLKCQELFSE